MELNAEQLQAVNSSSDRILCLAGAGAGKTRVLIERIAHQVESGISPESILVLTFTNAAAAEMKSRYEAKHIGNSTPEFRTFHAFCYSLLCKDVTIRSALGYTTVPAIATEEQEKNIKERARTQCNITLSKEKLDSREHLTKQEQYQADLFDKAVNRLMHLEDIITFDKLSADVAALFVADHIATHPYKTQYTYIYCDEFQDTDDTQIRFLNSFTKSNFFFTGDTLQNIYAWRGTSNEFIKILSNAPDWEKIMLHTNYRSTRAVCEYANKFSLTYADSSYRIEMQGTRDGDKVITKLVDGPKGYAAIDSKDIADVLKENSKLSGTSAILCRTNKEVAAVTSYLKREGVPFTTSNDTKLPKLLECALSATYMMEYLASYLSSDKYGEYIRISALVDNPDLSWFLANYGNNSQIKEDVRQINFLKDVANDVGTTADKITEVSKFFHIKNIKSPDKPYYGVEFLKYLLDAVLEIKETELYVGTIHSVKGLEYDNVFVMNVGSYSFRLRNEEMKNLFYVAITRAKNRLFVYELFDT